MNAGTQVLGYVRVSTQEQGDSGLGLEAQVQQIEAQCAARGWVLLGIESDVSSGKEMRKRTGMQAALRRIEAGEASVLVAAKVDRVSRSLVDFVGLLDRAARKGWSLVVLDAGVDTTTPHGEAMVGMLAVFAQLERRLISDRTRDALAVARKRGVQLGRPKVDPGRDRELRDRVQALAGGDRSLREIAAILEAEGVPTVTGRFRWSAAQVSRLATG